MFVCVIFTRTSKTWLGFVLISYHTVLLSPPACHPGFYKAHAGNIKCSKCPPHSFSYGEGASICRCEKSYFRAEKDPPTMACTREYTSKWSLIFTHLEQIKKKKKTHRCTGLSVILFDVIIVMGEHSLALFTVTLLIVISHLISILLPDSQSTLLLCLQSWSITSVVSQNLLRL